MQHPTPMHRPVTAGPRSASSTARVLRKATTTFVLPSAGALAALTVISCATKTAAPYDPYESFSFEDSNAITAAAAEQAEAIAAAARSNSEVTGIGSASCVNCHEGSHDPHGDTKATCTHCHGGDGTQSTKEAAHPRATFPDRWPEGGGNPERPYTLTLKESQEWIRFVNPGDYRVAHQTCAPCHPGETDAALKSVMATAGHFWGVATYANGIVSTKRSILGSSYGPDGNPQAILQMIQDPDGTWRAPTAEEMAKHSFAPLAVPLPRWEVTQPGNIYRVFERGSRLGSVGLGFNGLNTPIPGLPDKFEDPGRPNNRLSDRGLGTLNRVDLPTLNVHKTRLNDPHMGLMGTNDQPGDFRSSGCTGCHMVYANDRNPIHSGPWAVFGHLGKGNVDGAQMASSPWAGADDQAPDPNLPQDQSGHPIQHRFTKAIPSSQCMVCHMHQPNSFLNTYYGYQMWSYETDGELMWSPDGEDRSTSELFAIFDRNPEGAALRGKWGDRDFLAKVADDVNPKAKHTQFADYHGHGWNFRAVLKMDREGNLLDRDGKPVKYDDPDKFEGMIPKLGAMPPDVDGDGKLSAADIEDYFSPKPGRAVHLKDIHAEKGMHCVDCHFAQDVHGDGNLYAEYQAAVQIQCQDCHGTAEDYATLVPTGPAATSPGPRDKARGADASFLGNRRKTPTTPWGKPRFEDVDGVIIQRSMLYEHVEWPVSQVKDSVTPGHPEYNRKAAYAKLQKRSDGSCAHDPEQMDCASCHTSWITSCFGCHLPQEANWKSETHHYEGDKTRNLASYNPQVARDDVFMLGRSGSVKGYEDPATGETVGEVAVVRSTSAVIVSSKDAQRRIIYKQQPTVAANGLNGQAFNTHFAHTVRKTETRKCSDCHLSDTNDNNAWLAQVFLQGTNYVNFFGMHAYVGEGDGGVEAVKWTEWDEPQAAIGSDLHRMAFPHEYQDHLDDDRQLAVAEHHGGTAVQSVATRGEYLYTASGPDGFRVYDVANVANKDFSEKIVTSPVSPFGQDTHVPSRYATAVALPTNMKIDMRRPYDPANQEQNYPYKGKDQNLHESYRYAYISDRYEGLILVAVDCLSDGDPDNNFFERALTFNPDGILDGAENLAVAGTTVYVCCKRGVVVVDIQDPLAPKVIAEVGAPAIVDPTSVRVQFRYAFVTDAEGLKVIDVTFPERATAVPGAIVAIDDARDVYVARTFAYVSAGAEGLVIVDVKRPDRPSRYMTYDAEGKISDLNEVKVGMVYDSSYALLADGQNGFHVISLVTPADGGRSAYGFAPPPMPKWIASRRTVGPAMAIAKGLERDRAADESGHQVAVFGRIGGRPFTTDEVRKFILKNGRPNPIPDEPPSGWNPPGSPAPEARPEEAAAARPSGRTEPPVGAGVEEEDSRQP